MKRPSVEVAEARVRAVKGIIDQLQVCRVQACACGMVQLEKKLFSSIKSAEGALRNAERFSRAAGGQY